jgi:hypothetical protein
MSLAVLSEFFCCPPIINYFEIPSRFSGDPGFFKWKGLVLYGTCPGVAVENTASGQLCDVSSHSLSSGAQCRLAFDPAEVAENLRQERYIGPYRGWSRWQRDLMRSIYYYFRPNLTTKLRAPLQRLYFRHRRELQFPHWPVDTTVENICEKLMKEVCEHSREKEIPFIWFWPEGSEGCVMMTHDIEERAGLDFCGDLMDIDEAFGLQTAFEIVPEERYAIPVGFIDEMVRRGFEVNVQDLNHDGRLFQDRAEFDRRAVQIDQYRREFGAKGFRAASMYRNQDWYNQLNFQFDMSVPNVAHLEPQLGGCCTVMPYFIGRMVELPLTTTQDYSLFHILGDYSISLWKQQVDLILKKNGLISFLVHPDYIRNAREREVYLDLLRYLVHMRTSRRLWFALPGEVNDWWRQRAAMKLVWEENGWMIRGLGSERAQMAYARIVEDTVVYELSPKDPPPNMQSNLQDNVPDLQILSTEPAHFGSA